MAKYKKVSVIKPFTYKDKVYKIGDSFSGKDEVIEAFKQQNLVR